MNSQGTAPASRAESATINAAGLVQGIVLVTFPAASTIFTARGSYGLSGGQHGLMFVPQVATAITASLLGAGLLWPGLTRRVSEKRMYLAGLVADLAAMVLLIASWPVAHQHAAAYVLLLAATACLGAGFGLTVPSLNTLAAASHPAGVDKAVLVLNALLGLGTALAPAFVAAFVGFGFWIGLPLLAAVLLVVLIAVSLRLPLGSAQARQRAPAQPNAAVLPRNAPAADVGAFCLAGLGCSALLPLTISSGQENLAGPQAVVAGGVIAFYQAGYGIAAFGVGPLASAGVRLPAIFAAGAVVAVVLGGLSLVVAHRRPSPATVHPRPAQPRTRLSPVVASGEAPA
jgi:MFS family permease